MEKQPVTPRLMEDLALVYISLAHGTDEELSDLEVETIADRLRAWQDGVASGTVLAAIKKALEVYVQDGAEARVRQAVDQIAGTLPEAYRMQVLEDLVQIATADDRFLFSEASYIGDLCRAWGLHPDGAGAATGGTWSILGGAGPDHGWTPCHDLALVYLMLAHGPDRQVDEREVDTIKRKLHEWLPDSDEEQVLEVVRSAMGAYAQGPDPRLLATSVDALRRAVPEHQRGAVMHDLLELAGADGGVSPAEEALIARLAEAWQQPANL